MNVYWEDDPSKEANLAESINDFGKEYLGYFS